MTSESRSGATEPQEKVKEYVLEARSRGEVVFRGLPGQFMGAKLDDFVEQPADGILYDLNRDEPTVLTFIHDPKWVNDFAVALTIRKLVEQRDAARSASSEQGVKMPEVGIVESLSQSMDVEAAFNSREWLQCAVESKGAKVTGSGVGCGQADIDIELEGFRFNVSIKPL